MPDKEVKLHEGTKEALAGVLFCPICGNKTLEVIDTHLYKRDPDNIGESGYRKRREIACMCKACPQEGRGAVVCKISQWF